ELPILSLAGPWTGPAAEPVKLSPANTAYVIYTSGSTGRPNGLATPHRAAAELIERSREGFATGPESRLSQLASFTFDASVLEVFLALGSGATLVVARPEERVGEALADLLRRGGVTHLVITPPVLETLPVEGLPVEVVLVG